MKFKLLSNPIQLGKRFKFKKSKVPLKKRIKRFLILGGASLLTLMILMFAWYSKDLPTPGKIKSHKQSASTQLYDRNGKSLYAVSGDEKRILIDEETFKDPAYKNIRNATVAIEDKEFYNHHGFNLKSIVRAVLSDIQTGSKGQGGSTITQQYVKNALLTPEKNLTRKIKELILSIEIEFMFSKEQILNFYLNEIPYGGNVYGIQAASNRFFNKDAKDLTLAEVATLAALPQRTTYFSPYGSHLEDLISRKNLVLTRMAEQGYITQEEAEVAKNEPPLKRSDFTDPKETIIAPHFVFYVKEKLIELLGNDSLAERLVEEGGLKVTTTLDLEYQKIAEEVVKESTSVVRANANNAALVAADPQKGEILAMVGSLDYFDKDNDGNFNASTALRQPGSSFKPIVYSTAFKEGYAPSTVLFDLKTDFNGYVPKNFDGKFRGPITIRKALGNSLNIPAVKTLSLVGLDDALKTAKDLGITTLNDKDRYGLALALGGGEVKLVDMVSAYGVFANYGKILPQTPILKVEDSSGKVLYDSERDRKEKQALEPEVAYEISDILSDLDAKKPVFNLKYLSLPNQQLAAKTGTTNDTRDAWTMGYTTNLVAGVWVGNNDNTSLRGGGSMAAAPIWHTFMAKVSAMRPKENFQKPDGISDFTVEYYSGKKPTQYSQKTIKDIFAPWQIPTKNDDVNVVKRVCISNGFLASKDTPQALTEERVFAMVHSKRPDNPAWENPVIAWAKSNGYYNPPPTNTCTETTVKPSISITSPSTGAKVSGNFAIKVEGTTQFAVASVEIFIDGISVTSGASLPFETTYNANNLSSGGHTVSARVIDSNQSSSETSVIFEVSKDTTPPGLASSVSITKSGSNIVASWTSPTDSDFSQMNIYYSTISGQIGTKYSSKTHAPGTSATMTISGLPSGVYNITLRAQDTTGNENTNLNQYPISL